MTMTAATLKAYYQLTKPGIIYGNATMAAGGFLLASQHHIDLVLMVATLVGISLVIACGCVFNNYIDRGIDKKMARTKQRALVSGAISGRSALIYAVLLGTVGFTVLTARTNFLTVCIGIVGLVDYVVLYGFYKRRSVYGTLVGTISGSTPLVAGYMAVTGRFDGAALILFLLWSFWQMAHFYGIAMYRHDDYAAAHIPVLPVIKGMRQTKIQVLAYIVAFTLAAVSLTIFGYTGRIYLVVMSALGLAWLVRSVRTFHTLDDKKWGRKVFLFSLIVTLATAAMLAIGARLP